MRHSIVNEKGKKNYGVDVMTPFALPWKRYCTTTSTQ
jgi:hypothetical protein